jgi:hypothetical protein
LRCTFCTSCARDRVQSSSDRFIVLTFILLDFRQGSSLPPLLSPAEC